MRFSSVASVIRQSKGSRQSKRTLSPPITVSTAYTGNLGRRNGGRDGGKRGGKRMTAAELAIAKLTEWK